MIRVFTAFSGYDSQCLALNRLGLQYDLVGWSEIDTIQAAGISNCQQYKMAGNSIVVDVLAAIFNKIYINTQNETKQQSLFFL